jgi:S1-C subfamily serine protease
MLAAILAATRATMPFQFDACKVRRFSAGDLSVRLAQVAALAAMLAFGGLQPAAARGPENIADVAEQVIDAVVNISTSQKIDPRVTDLPDLPPGSPMEEFFDQFFKNRRAAPIRRHAGSTRSAQVSSSTRRAWW